MDAREIITAALPVIAEEMRLNPEFGAKLIAAIGGNLPAVESVPVESVPVPVPEWYSWCYSDDTEVTSKPKSAYVYVKVARGHAPEWKDRLKSAGFRWMGKKGYGAPKDAARRAENARRYLEDKAATEGMTPDEVRAYYAAKRAARQVA